MSRALFERWGLKLPAEDFARALAARGILENSVTQRVVPETAEAIAAALFALLSPLDAALAWAVSWPSQASPYNAEVLAQAWRQFTLQAGKIRLEICSASGPFDPVWLVETLSAAAVGVASAYIAKQRRSHDRWHWPLRIGFLPDHASADLLRQVRQAARKKQWRQDLTTLIELGEVESHCDLLVIPHGPRAAFARILDCPAALRATSVVLLGAVNTNRADAVRLIKQIDEQLYSNAICLLSGDLGPPAAWLHEFITQLSHDLPFDLALAHSLDRSAIRPSSFLMANGEWSSHARLSTLTTSLKKKFEQPHVRVESFHVDSILAGRLNVPKGPVLIANVGPMPSLFDRESHGATTLAHLTKAVRHQLRAAEPAPEPRRVQAQVFRVTDTSPQIGPITLFSPDEVHRVDVRIGAPEQGWVSSSVHFPDEKLPPSKEGHVLTVVFLEPDLATEPQVGHVFLPPTGPSDICPFHFHVPAHAKEIHARIVISYKNRVLQTSVLEGAVKSGSNFRPHGAIKIVPEVVVSAGMADLDRQGSYGAALVFNQTPKGNHKVLKLVDDSAVLISTANVSDNVRKIEEELGRCDWGHKDFRSMGAKGTLQLLRFLAAHGRVLHRGIVKAFFGDSQLASSDRIQLIAAKPDSRLPVEYFYELDAPGPKAVLCPEAIKRFNAGSCSDKCSARKNPQKYVCPFAFWGMSKVLEWHTFRPAAAGELQSRDYALQRERIALRKQLKPLSRATVGASYRANEEVKDSVPKLLAFIKKSKVPARFVKTWPEWKKSLASDSPSLLVLIPHTDTDQTLDMPKMEIGNEQWLTIAQLEEEYVRSPKVPPVVLLLGCDTAQQHVSFENFISSFSTQGAAIIVASSTTILGRQATVLAHEFIRVMSEFSRKGGKTFGDVMLAVRRNMMRRGYPMVLSISSYGDADWRL